MPHLPDAATKMGWTAVQLAPAANYNLSLPDLSQTYHPNRYYIQDVPRKGVIHTNTNEQNRMIEELYKAYEQPMYRIAYAILKDVQQAEDAVHDAFLAVLKSDVSIADVHSSQTKHYMVQVIRHTAINRYRKNASDAERYTVLDDTASQIPDRNNLVEKRMKQVEQREIADTILNGLSESEREILHLRCEEELSYSEIAERLSLSEPTVRKRFERARKAAQKQKGAHLYGKEIFTV